MERPIAGDEVQDPETQKVMEELRTQGHEFAVDPPKDAPAADAPKVEPAPKEEPKPEADKPKEGDKPEGDKPKDEDEDGRTERQPRQPKMIPEWQVKMNERRAAKAAAPASALPPEVTETLQKLTSEIELLKQNREGKKEDAPDELSTIVKSIVEEHGLDEQGTKLIEGILKPIMARIPKGQPSTELPAEVKEALSTLSSLREKDRLSEEDRAYEQDFSKRAVPKIREAFPHATEEDIAAIREGMKDYYFDPKYVNLSADEVYALKSSDLAKHISPPKRATAEKGTRGVSRDDTTTDYSSVTEEEFNRMSSEEQERVVAFKSSQSRV